jgi:hypothetical protein
MPGQLRHPFEESATGKAASVSYIVGSALNVCVLSSLEQQLQDPAVVQAPPSPAQDKQAIRVTPIAMFRKL